MNMQTADTSMIQDVYPLSPTQQGMLFHGLLSPNSGVYVIQLGFSINGELDLNAFEQAWDQLQSRYDILRTAFAWEKLEQPMQVVGRKSTIPIEVIDWRNRQDTDVAYKDWLQQDRKNGFDARRAPLMRITLFRLSDTRARAVCSYHHLLMDGWSLPVLLRDWFVCYQAAASSSQPTLPAPIPYRDYIAWLQNQDKQKAKDFWKRELASYTEPNSFHTDVDGSTVDAEHGSQTISLDKHAFQALQSFARENRLTMSTIVQAVWALLVHRYSASNDVVFGLARSGRPATLDNIEHRVGLFLNLLPMRTRIDNEQTLLDWLQALQQQLLQQQPYEFTALRDVHDVSEIASSTPLFDSIVVFENYPMPTSSERDTGNIGISDIEISEQTNYPLSLYACAEATLNLKLLFDTSRFSASAIARMLQQLVEILCRLPMADSTTVADVLNLSEQILQDDHVIPNCTADDSVVLDVEKCIATQATDRAEHSAVVCGQQILTYAELNTRANQLANYLVQQGIKPGQRVGICLRRSVELPIAMLAILRSGCAWLPLDADYPAGRLQHIIEDAHADAVIVHEATKDALPAGDYQALNIETDSAAIDAQPDQVTDIACNMDDIAYLIYTSGSTGTPKGVQVSRNNLANLLGAMAQRIGFNANNTLLAVTTFAFDIATLELLLPLVNGATLVIADEQQCRDGSQLAQLIDEQQITVLQATPATWRLLLAVGWQGGNTLCALSGGEAIDVATAQQLLERCASVWNVYGPTETTIWSTALQITPVLLDSSEVPIGNALANTVLHVLDADCRPLPRGVVGELCIGGLGVSAGYHGLAEMTAERFIDNPVSQQHDAMPLASLLYRTGDLVRQREDGLFDFIGRIDQQTKIRGYRIELGEIENVMAAHSAVQQAVVAVANAATAQAKLIAVVTLNSDYKTEIAPATLRTHMEHSLPIYMLPQSIEVVQQIPLTPNGKIDRKAVIAMAAPVTGSGTQPRTPLQRELISVWQQVTGSENVGADDNFFEIGGHSLLIVRAQSELKHKLGIELELVDLFRYPTPASLAAHIEQSKQADDPQHIEQKRHTQQAGLARRQALKARRRGTVSTTG